MSKDELPEFLYMKLSRLISKDPWSSQREECQGVRCRKTEQELSLSLSPLACLITASGFNISPSSPPMAWGIHHVPSKPRKGTSCPNLSSFFLPSQKWHKFMVMMFCMNLFFKQGPACHPTEMEKGQPFLPFLHITILPFRRECLKSSSYWSLFSTVTPQTQTPPLPFLGYEQVLGVLARPLLQCSFCL